MADKKASTQDVVEAFALATGKPAANFGVQEFENVDGEQSVALVDLASGSICLQANGDNGAQRLLDSIQAGTLTFVDAAKAPKSNPVVGREVGPGYGGADVSTQEGVADISKPDRSADRVLTGDEAWAELPRNDKNQVVIDDNGFIQGTKGNTKLTSAATGSKPAKDATAKAAAAAE